MGLKEDLQLVLGPTRVSENMVVAVAHLDAISEEDRCRVFRLYCPECGKKNPWHPSERGINGFDDLSCRCMDDE